VTISAVALLTALADVLGIAVDRESVVPVSGGSIHQAWRLRTAHGFVFVKAGDTRHAATFEAEAAGLAALRESNAYEASWPVDNGARVRTTLYNLYHVLNHFNMFGGAYRQQAASMIDELLAEIGH
jgi:fructosamine-3-kinase